MSQPVPYPTEPRRSNGLGIAGFIVSLVGIFTLGLLCPLGLLLSFFALFRRPRGFAIAGFIIGLLGTIVAAALISMFGFAVFSCFTLGKPFMQTGISVQQTAEKIRTFQAANMNALPPQADAERMTSSSLDGWGHPLRYQQTGPGTFQIRSAGPDGIFDNADDVTEP